MSCCYYRHPLGNYRIPSGVKGVGRSSSIIAKLRGPALVLARNTKLHPRRHPWRNSWAQGAICVRRSLYKPHVWRFFLFIYLFFAHFHFPASGQAVVTGVFPSPPRFLPSTFTAHRVQQSHCLSIVHQVLLTHALALSASQFVHKKKSQRIYTSMHSAGLELTKLTYTRLEDNLIRHRGDRHCQ